MKPYRPTPLVDLLRALSTDMHQASTRGCQTCRDLTENLGWPFGCYQLQAERRTRQSTNGSTQADKPGSTIKGPE